LLLLCPTPEAKSYGHFTLSYEVKVRLLLDRSNAL